jgi:hypothetical protein
MRAYLYRLGKKLRLQISNNYKEDGSCLSGNNKRNPLSVTKEMFTLSSGVKDSFS